MAQLQTIPIIESPFGVGDGYQPKYKDSIYEDEITFEYFDCDVFLGISEHQEINTPIYKAVKYYDKYYCVINVIEFGRLLKVSKLTDNDSDIVNDIKSYLDKCESKQMFYFIKLSLEEKNIII